MKIRGFFRQKPGPQSGTNRFIDALKSKRLRIFLLVIAILLIAVSVVLVYRDRETVNVDSEEHKYAQELLESDDSNETKSKIVQQYGPEYDATLGQVMGSKPDSWDKSTLDTAYRNLLYADKMSSFTQVKDLLSKIEFMRRSGMNIDDNSYGITQEDRDAIRGRASASEQEVPVPAGVQN